MFRRRYRKQTGGGRGARRAFLSLSGLAQDAKAVILTNGDKQTLEMGMFPDVVVRALKSRHPNPNVVAVAGGNDHGVINKRPRRGSRTQLTSRQVAHYGAGSSTDPGGDDPNECDNPIRVC